MPCALAALANFRLEMDVPDSAGAVILSECVWRAQEEHLGHFVCDLKDIINAETTHGGRILSKANEGVDDASFLQFDVVRILRDSTTPREMFEAFFKADTDKTRCLDFHDFREVVSKLAAGQGQKVGHACIDSTSLGLRAEAGPCRYRFNFFRSACCHLICPQC